MSETIELKGRSLVRPEVEQGDFILLKGKSRHGKNRIHQWGDAWAIQKEGLFRGQPAWLLTSFIHGGDGPDLRWVLKKNDPNFEVVA